LNPELDAIIKRKYIVVIKDLRFGWDPEKADANLRKHGVSFEEATSVFYDGLAVEFYDDENSEWEDRFLLLGLSATLRLLMVCHCYREEDRSFASSLLVRQRRTRRSTTQGDNMKAEYDLSQMKSRRNPYARQLKKQVTLRVRPDVIEYFKAMAEETGIPYQSLINLYLQDCMASHRKLDMQWAS
jgi:uncharacterized DUF497 family protein/predicted DNA binding CopG/RHH family protein